MLVQMNALLPQMMPLYTYSRRSTLVSTLTVQCHKGQISPVPLEVSPSDIISAIQSFPAGSAGGPDGLRPQHLKDLIMDRSGFGATLLSQALSRFVNFVISGEVLDTARLFFFGASLIALSKPEGGVRPIAVGCTLRHLVGKCASQSIREAMGDLLSPLQLGYGTPLGAEACYPRCSHLSPQHAS